VPGEHNLDDLIKAVRRGGGLAKLRTFEGSDLKIEERTGDLLVSDSRGETGAVIISDLLSSNGIAHVVDTVFIPGDRVLDDQLSLSLSGPTFLADEVRR
jgi:uncharacterized surface protein with fasciclin (FAS1) repeats